jgi:cyclic-di-GMP-binding biofilm dispersal mediator protein
LTALGKEWRREGIRVISARPGHTETGLASRAIAGQAPTFPAGMTTEHVVARLVAAIEADEKDLASSDF